MSLSSGKVLDYTTRTKNCKGVKFSIYTGDDDSTTEAHIRQKVAYDVEKFSDIIHMKRSLTTRLYNLGQNAKFDNCSPQSQKVINHLVKCFSYAIAQNKGDSKGIQAALRCIIPHALGDHCNCAVTWCGFKSDPASYKHKDLAPVVQTLDSAILWINHYPLDNSIGFASVYPLDSNLSGGQRYPSFEQLGPAVWKRSTWGKVGVSFE